MSNRIGRLDLVNALKALADDLGRPPTRDEMEKQGRYSAIPYYREFDSWPAALEAASLDVRHRQGVPEKELIKELRRLAKELGHTPRKRDMDEHGQFSASTYVRRFGSWLDARAKAGLTEQKVQLGQQIPQEDLILALHMLARELGRPPSQSEMDEQGLFSSDSYHRHFESWKAALEAAGLALE